MCALSMLQRGIKLFKPSSQCRTAFKKTWPPGQNIPPNHVKMLEKRPGRRVWNSIVMEQLKQEEIERWGGYNHYEIKVGDYVRLLYHNSLQVEYKDLPEEYEGLIICIRRRGIDSSFLLRGMKEDCIFEVRFPLYSKWIISIKRLRAYRVKRNKLLNSRNWDTVEPWEKYKYFDISDEEKMLELERQKEEERLRKLKKKRY